MKPELASINLMGVMAITNNNRLVDPNARKALDQMKYEVSRELGIIPENIPNNQAPQYYEQVLDNLKYEVADELGLNPQNGYWGHITSRDCGRVGGNIGGYIGGQMVKRMIEIAEQKLAEENPEQKQ